MSEILSEASVRSAYPLASINPIRFIRSVVTQHEGIENPNHARAELVCVPRPDVQSGLWWTLEWLGADLRKHSVSAQYLDLLFWRAAEAEAKAGEDWGKGPGDA